MLFTIFSNKIAVILFVIVIFLLSIISVIISITSIFSYSVNLALDDSASLIYEYVNKRDNEINEKIDEAEENYSNIEQFIYDISKNADTNPEQIYAFLKAKYGEKELSEDIIKAEINQIHNNLYKLSFIEENSVMTIKLVSKTFSEYFEEYKEILLSETQIKEYYEILKLIQENVGKILLNPFPGIDWRKYVTSEYGYRLHPINHTYSKHTGMDIGMPEGTKIYSCMNGTARVINSGNTCRGTKW